MVVEHPYGKKIEDIFRKVAVEVRIVGEEEPVTGIVHVDKGLRLSDHLNRSAGGYLILTDALFEGEKREVLFLQKEQIKVIFPVQVNNE